MMQIIHKLHYPHCLRALPSYPEAAHASPDEPSSAAGSPPVDYMYFLQERYFKSTHVITA